MWSVLLCVLIILANFPTFYVLFISVLNYSTCLTVLLQLQFWCWWIRWYCLFADIGDLAECRNAQWVNCSPGQKSTKGVCIMQRFVVWGHVFEWLAMHAAARLSSSPLSCLTILLLVCFSNELYFYVCFSLNCFNFDMVQNQLISLILLFWCESSTIQESNTSIFIVCCILHL